MWDTGFRTRIRTYVVVVADASGSYRNATEGQPDWVLVGKAGCGVWHTGTLKKISVNLSPPPTSIMHGALYSTPSIVLVQVLVGMEVASHPWVSQQIP